MEHVITAPHSGIVRAVTMAAGDVVREGFPIVFIAGGRGRRAARSPPPTKLDLGPHPRRSARKHRTSRVDAGRKPARRGGAAAQDRPSHAARKHRAAGRSRLVQGILAADRRAPAPAPYDRGAAQEHARRWRRRRHVLDQRRSVRRDAVARRAGALRLHRAGGHAGPPQPLQAGPDVRTVPPLPPAAGPVRRGRRRTSRRGLYRPARRDRHPHLHHLFAAQRPRAADRRRQRPHLRRQHRAGGLQRRDHRHRGLDHRHGRPGDDRRRRPGHLHARGSRPDVVPGAEWRRRYPGEGRSSPRSTPRRNTCRISRGRSRPGRRTTSAGCATSCRKTGCACTTCATSSKPSPTRARCWRSARNSASASSPRSSGSKAGRWA